MAIGDREICNRPTGYFSPSVGQEHRLFRQLPLRGHNLLQWAILTGPKLLRSTAKKSSAKKVVLHAQWSTIPDYFHGLRNKGDDPELLEDDLVRKSNDKGAGNAT